MKKQKESKNYYNKDVVDLYDNGLNVQEISEKLSKKLCSISRILSQCSDKFTKDIVDRYQAGEGSEPIALNMLISTTLVRNILRRESIEIKPQHISNKKYSFNDDYFENIDTQNKAYWLGFLYADGCVSYKSNKTKLHLQTRDIDVLHALAKEIFVSDYKIYEYKTSVCLEISSAKIKEDLVKHGCTPRKTFTVRMPYLKPELTRHFLRGLFDGDGCYCVEYPRKKKNGGYNTRKTIITITGSADFIIKDVLAHLQKTLNLDGGYINKAKNTKLAVARWSAKNDLEKIIDYLYKDSKIHLERKFEKTRLILDILKNIKARTKKVKEKFCANI